MKCDSEDDLFIVVASTLITIKRNRARKRRPKCWVNSYLQKRNTKGRFSKDFQDLRCNPDVFKENFHMSPVQFDDLLALLLEKLTATRVTRNDCLSATEKLAVTLEYLASGTLQRHIASCYRISKQHFGRVLELTCEAIYNGLLARFPLTKSARDWIDVSHRFNSLWNFPNAIGAIDGKHCAIKCPNGAGSIFYNYKGFHSVNLMAVSDADYRFTFFDVGAFGSEGDSTVFSSSSFGKKLFSGNLNLPKDQVIYGRKLPFLFLADDAFPLHPNIMKPYKPTKRQPTLDDSQRVFNYRLSRGRRCIENAFGILCARWQCLARTMFVNPDKARKIIAACCVLHNYLMKQSKEIYCPNGFADTFAENGEIIPGSFRLQLPNNSMFYTTSQPNLGGRPIAMALSHRDHLKSFFNSIEGELEWQSRSIFK